MPTQFPIKIEARCHSPRYVRQIRRLPFQCDAAIHEIPRHLGDRLGRCQIGSLRIDTTNRARLLESHKHMTTSAFNFHTELCIGQPMPIS